MLFDLKFGLDKESNREISSLTQYIVFNNNAKSFLRLRYYYFYIQFFLYKPRHVVGSDLVTY
jgi:hypothetical protein